MSSLKNLLSRGNTKLGEGVFAFSIPAVLTCPGRTPLCQEACYARRGRFATGSIRSRLEENLGASGRPGFAARMIAEIRRRGVHILRVHVSGDFYDAGYVEAWCRIARMTPRVRLYCYSRSWRVPSILPALNDLSREPNMRLWWSLDRDTGWPASVPPGVNLAWLDDGEGAEGAREADLIFRIRRLRPEVPTLYPLRLVCTSERPGQGETTCSDCQKCWTDGRDE